MILWSFSANSYAVTYTNVGADAHIGPLGSYEFAEDFRKKPCILRADRVVGLFDSSEFAEDFRKKRYALPGRCGHRPLQNVRA